MKNRHLPAVALVCLLSAPFAAWAAEDPDDPAALFARGVELAESGRLNEAAQVFAELIEGHPELPEAYNNLAVIQAAAGDFDDAVSTLKSALATNSSYQTAYENLTRIYAQLASEAYSRALEVDSPPAREQVELEMLARLSSAPAQPMAGEKMAERKLTPAEPMPETASEPVAAAPDETAEAEAPAAAGEAAEVVAEAGEAGIDEVETVTDSTAPTEPAVVSEEDVTTDLAEVVESWARAWSEQRVEDYLGFYADEFLPSGGMSRPDWESRRRQRLEAPEFINVEVAILDSVTEAADRARVTFLQAYESNTYADQVTKTLTLVRRGSGWKILEEKSGS